MAAGKKGKKVGRSKRNGQALKYRNEQRYHKNKYRKVLRHINTKGENDKVAQHCLRLLIAVLPLRFAA